MLNGIPAGSGRFCVQKRSSENRRQLPREPSYILSNIDHNDAVPVGRPSLSLWI